MKTGGKRIKKARVIWGKFVIRKAFCSSELALTYLFSNLARLVPSTEFEQKRRQINKHLLEEIEKDEEPVLCGKKKKKKKKKKKNKDDEPEEVVMVSFRSFCRFSIIFFAIHVS